MIAYENTILQFKKDVRAKRLANFMCAEYEAAAGHPVSGEFRYGWKYALSILYDGLERLGAAVNPDAGIRIDLKDGTPVTHLKIMFASASDGGYRYTVFGLFAGSSVKLTKADDIVCFREGTMQWTTVHPSKLTGSYARHVFRGIPREEAHCVSYESASFLFDCFYSCDTDILSDYRDPLTAESPVFYANDREEAFGYLERVLRNGRGRDALRKLSEIEKLSAQMPPQGRNEDQIYLISSITNNVLRKRKAWYIIEGQTGTGKGEIIRAVIEKLEKEGKNVQILKESGTVSGCPDLLVINQAAGGRYEQLPSAGVSVFLCDGLREQSFENIETDAALTVLARENGAQLFISHLKESVFFADSGRGMRWLANRLQLARIRREDYDPDLYEICLVDSQEELDAGRDRDLAQVILPANIIYDRESGRIHMKKTQRKGIYRVLSTGRKGALIFCADPGLRSYLADEITALRRRNAWAKDFVSGLAGGRILTEQQMDTLAQDSMALYVQRNAEYRQKVRQALGREAWEKIDEISKTWIISALMAYDGLKRYDRLLDFSGVCVQIGKACEYELKRRIFTDYVDYEKKTHGEEKYLERLPAECMDRQGSRKARTRKLLDEDKISLGKMRYIMGLDDEGRVVDKPAWDEFEIFAKDVLLAEPEEPLRVFRNQLTVINKIRDEYRNRSAHSQAISIVDAGECIEYVLTVHRKLGEILDQYRY